MPCWRSSRIASRSDEVLPPLLDQLQRLLVGVFHAEQPADDAGLAVEMQDVGVAHDVVGAGRADDQHRHVLGDHARRGRRAMPSSTTVGFSSARLISSTPCSRCSQAISCANVLGIAVPPAGPETALAAIIAQMRTAARELHDHGALAAPIAVAAVVDQLPADAVIVEIGDRLRRPGGEGPAADRRERRCRRPRTAAGAAPEPRSARRSSPRPRRAR